jgi:probable O-glycosylation ligase (exosortase A-associated)
MRDVVLSAVIIGLLPIGFLHPIIGVYVSAWLTYMVPHRLTWGFAYDVPWVLMTTAALFLGWLISREPHAPPRLKQLYLYYAFILWTLLCYALGPWQEYGADKIDKMWKGAVFLFIAASMFTTIDRIRLFLLVATFSIAFYGVKGSMWSVATGGAFHLHGPADSSIGDRNHLAVAFVMIVPLLWYLFKTETIRALRWAILVALYGSAFGTLATWSRGGAITGAAVVLAAFLRSKRKTSLAIILPLVGVTLVPFIPEAWYLRVESIETYDQDRSALGRLEAWEFALRVAYANPIFGNGAGTFNKLAFELYAPEYIWRAAHSIYFETVAESGFVGLGLLIIVFISGLATARKLSKLGRRHPEIRNYGLLGDMILLSLIGHVVGGLFLSLASFSLPYELVVIAGLALIHARKELSPAPAPQATRVPPIGARHGGTPLPAPGHLR